MLTKNEAINQLKELIKDAQSHMNGDGDDVIFEDDVEALKMGIKALTDKWIPCSERLPENKERVLVTCKCSHGLKTSILRYAKDLYKIDVIAFEDKRGEGGWYDYDSEYGYYNITGVIAWMPISEPYEGGVKHEWN